MDSIVPPAIFLALVLFFVLCGFARWPGFFGAWAFVLIMLYSLNRPVQSRGSYLLLFLAFSAIVAGLERRWLYGILGGAILGFLVGVYVWAWTFGWLWLGLLFLTALAEWSRHRSQKAARRIGLLCIFSLVGVFSAIPALLSLWNLSQQPLYAETVFRSGIHPGRLPESWPYSILFTVMAIGVLIARRKSKGSHRTDYAVITVLTAFIAIHQQVLHGTVFNFVSHYLFALVAAAICVVLLWNAMISSFAGRKKLMLRLSTIAAVIYLAAIAYDGRHIINQWTVRDSRFREQHFATLLPVLDALPRSTILSDPTTEMFLAGSTKHDVVYSLYLKNVLMSHKEIAERFCATQIPVPPAERHLELQQPIYPDADGAFSGDPTVPAREQEMIRVACNEADSHAAKSIRAFHPQYILWDELRHPEWNLRRFHVPLTKAASGSGWSLWSLHRMN